MAFDWSTIGNPRRVVLPEKPAPVFKPGSKPIKWEEYVTTTASTTTTTTTSAPSTVKEIMKLVTEVPGDDGYLTDIGYQSDEPAWEKKLAIEAPPTTGPTTIPYDPLEPFEHADSGEAAKEFEAAQSGGFFKKMSAYLVNNENRLELLVISTLVVVLILLAWKFSTCLAGIHHRRHYNQFRNMRTHIQKPQDATTSFTSILTEPQADS